jgi:CheY-like chemotaxis protein
MPAVAVIDEEEAVCDQAGNCFRRAGFAVRSAITADAGIAMLQRERFDLVLVDVCLRDASGTLVAQIAANFNRPVLLTTMHADAASRLRRFDFPHLLKPFDFAQLSRESVRVIAENRQTTLRVILNLERMRRNLADLEAATADARRLIAVSQALLASCTPAGGRPALDEKSHREERSDVAISRYFPVRGGHSPPVTGAPSNNPNPFDLVRLADRKIASGATEQAEELINAAYEAYDQCGSWVVPRS